MKKRVLFLATILVAITAVMFCTKNSVKAASVASNSIEKSNELISYKISLPSNYYYGKKISKMILHYGINGWNNTKDVTMYVTTNDYHYGIPASYVYNAVIKVHKGDTINYCFKTISTEGTTSWNNNNGNDFSVVANESNVKTIEYEIDWLANQNGINVDNNSDVYLHYGINGWDNPKDVKMELKTTDEYNGKKYTWYKAIITVEEGCSINYCVKINTKDNVIWDNNQGSNYLVIAK